LAADIVADTESKSQDESKSFLQSIRRGITVLDAVADSLEPLSARRIAEIIGLDRTITHRILRTLELDEMVVQGARGYQLGPKILQLGDSFLRHHPLRLASLPYQVDLLYRGYPNQPWILSVLRPVQRKMAIVTQVWSPTAPLDSLLAVQEHAIEDSAAGRCVLAYLTKEQAVRRVGQEVSDALEPRLQQIREAGGVDFNPGHGLPTPDGLLAISATIRTRTGVPVAGLTMSGAGLEDHITRNSVLANRLIRTAAQIGALLNTPE
jgi:IclR family transcriptional regulator, pca regulon regulatory protein